jgi:hypothetical protein
MPSAHEIVIPSFRVPVRSGIDLCVIGGGAAGMSAAVGAARAGLKVLMIEKYGFCGGATVAGLSGTICGLYSSGDAPHQIVFGFAGEFYDALKQRGGASSKPIFFGKTALVPHDSFVWKEIADHFLQNSEVEVLFHTHFLKAYPGENGQVEMILVRGMEGFQAIQAAAFIDASGDADVVHSLGGSTTLGKNGVIQSPTMIFRVGNVDMQSFLRLDPQEICERVAEADKSGAYTLPRHHVYVFPLPSGHEVLCNMTRITYPDGRTPVGTSSRDLTFAEMEGRRQAREYARFLKDKISAFSNSYLVETGAQVGIRQTRSIIGKTRLQNADVLAGRKWKGAATFSAWPIEVHEGDALKIAYLADGVTYDVPFEALIPTFSSNLLVAGRCLSAEHEALASARVTAQCFGMGYAAGAAAALMLREKISSQELTGVQVADWMHNHHLKTSEEK